MPQSLDVLIARLDTLLEDLVRAEAEHADVIAAVIGATSLATTEAHVRAKVFAARNVLAALRGDVGPWDLEAIDDALDDRDEILGANSHAIFGPMRPGRPTRIMVTLPSEAADAPELVAAFVDAGMDVARTNCARTNCAHEEPAAWARMGRIRPCRRRQRGERGAGVDGSTGSQAADRTHCRRAVGGP